MKKLTPNQQQYLKEIRRIRTNLSKLRREGYDVSDLASRYTTKLPSRVTKKQLTELHDLTARKIRKEVHNKFYGMQPPKRTRLNAPVSTYTEEISIKPVGASFIPEDRITTLKVPKSPSDPYHFKEITIEEHPMQSIMGEFAPTTTGYEFPPDFMEIPSDTEPEPEEPEQEEPHITQQIVDLDKGKVITVDVDTGEIVEEADLYIEENEMGEEVYINGDTGDIVGINKFAKYNIPDMNDYAMEMLYDIVNQFPLNYQQPMRNALDKMIEQKGLSAVADAFTQTMNNRPNLLDKLSNAREKYNEAVALLEEMADILDVPINLKQDIKDYVYRESMADIETYGT